MKSTFAAVAALVLGYVAPAIAADPPMVVIRAEVNAQGQEVAYSVIPFEAAPAISDDNSAQELNALVDQKADSVTDAPRRFYGGWRGGYNWYRPNWYGHSYYPYYRYSYYPYNYYYYPYYYWPRRW